MRLRESQYDVTLLSAKIYRLEVDWCMALVTIVGYPCSGKSTRAVQLVSAVEKHLSDATYTGPRFRVVIVDDESNHIPRSVYDGERLPLG